MTVGPTSPKRNPEATNLNDVSVGRSCFGDTWVGRTPPGDPGSDPGTLLGEFMVPDEGVSGWKQK